MSMYLFSYMWSEALTLTLVITLEMVPLPLDKMLLPLDKLMLPLGKMVLEGGKGLTTG